MAGPVLIRAIASLLVLAGCIGEPQAVPDVSPVIIKQSGGAGAVLVECQDKNYLMRKADYIIEGTVTGVESCWNEEKTGIFTYSTFIANSYIKGTPLPTNNFQIITPGGTVGDITQIVEDQPIFHEGERVRLYLDKVNDELSIICGRFGMEDLGLQAVPVP